MRQENKWLIVGAVGVVVLLALVVILFALRSWNGEEATNTVAPQAETESVSASPDDSGGSAASAPSAAASASPSSLPEASPSEEPSPTPKPTPSVETDIPSVAETYADDFPIGAAVEPNQLSGLTAELLKKQVNSLVAENAMKPDAIQPSEGVFTWDRADQIVKFAMDNGMAVRFHTLVWHSQTPNWYFLDEAGKPMVDETDSAKREANKKLLLKRLDTYVRTVVARYKDDIKSWDVVNEVVEPGDPDGMRASNWYLITGTDYIETAFRAAREAGGKDIKLYINDYGTDAANKRDRIYELVKTMLDKGVPIDGVGHQTHINLLSPSVDAMLASFNKFKELGLDNIITELDMSLYTWNDRSDYGEDVPQDVLLRQAARYRELFDALKANKGLVSAVTFWGIADNHTWLSSFPITRTEAPFLFDKYYHAKPAFWAVVDPSKLDI
ncbi:endo-1,4-beta-xylanase [Cohnella fermenti]|uniref:Beta-xylanase n=1 Tax=Cohnella fermenti TaxID=2565925 RepID=A0A4S4BK19_9BACL|nr:endo-1,4-beta-xylanase [Cohnella fermenti]THF74079.1 endo-1,4-beta-xylanase [Cohnella fermenti]